VLTPASARAVPAQHEVDGPSCCRLNLRDGSPDGYNQDVAWPSRRPHNADERQFLRLTPLLFSRIRCDAAITLIAQARIPPLSQR